MDEHAFPPMGFAVAWFGCTVHLTPVRHIPLSGRGEILIYRLSGSAQVRIDTGYPHDGRADNTTYRQDRCADKRR